MKNLKCPNKNIKNPVPIKMISDPYAGLIGWADEEANEYGIKRFCSIFGDHPYQYNALAKEVEAW